MNRNFLCSIFLIPMIILLYIPSVNLKITKQSSDECIKTFQDFAYFPSTIKSTSIKPELIPPVSPWYPEAVLPSYRQGNYFANSINTEIARIFNGHNEIWLNYKYSSSDIKNVNKNSYSIYFPETKNWELIPVNIDRNVTSIQELFITTDNIIWGLNTIPYDPDNEWTEKVPLISKFNDKTRHFDFATGVLEIQLPIKFHVPSLPRVLLDSNDIFWIFIDDDGIYRFDPSKQITEKQIDLANFKILDVALSPNGYFYIEKEITKIYEKGTFFQVTDGLLFKYSPITKELNPVKLPEKPWPLFNGLLVDKKERLWLGSIGYREFDGTWKSIHPDPDLFFKHAGDPYWYPPRLLFESSDNILWFKKDLDGDTRATGTAWYDPQTNTGCLFTNIPTNVIEDAQKQIWLVADGKLYSK